ncbi:Rieske domain-containing protein-like isoform X2 [Hypomesus transpacificus]|nr:Rieske domain-containing protein-like isoform X2 [Hypomesus transpacificus]
MSSEEENTSPPPSSSASLPPSSSASPPPSSSSSLLPSSSASPPPSFSASPPPSPHFIGKREDIMQAGRVVRRVNDCRDVLVLYYQGEFHAMDLRCYHSGGPLQGGDIEDFNGRKCIVCPWHKYKITLAEGEGLYQAVNPSVKPPKPTWRSKGVKQRVHKVTEADGNIYLTLNDSGEAVESDFYQTERYRELFQRTQPKPLK